MNVTLYSWTFIFHNFTR